MKSFQKLADARYARPAAQFMRYVCYFVIFFHVLCLVLSLMGRQTFALHTSQGTYDWAIYAEEDHDPTSRVFTVSVNDDIFVWANEEDQIELTTHLALSLMFALGAVPLIFAYWFLSRVFSNISRGQIFTEQNARCLLDYGLMQMIVALPGPLLKQLVCFLANQIADSRISLHTGTEVLNTLIPSIAFLVAAYIIRYGIYLQDEVDHTL